MDPKILVTEAANFLDLSLGAVHKQLRVKDLNFEKTSHRSYFGHKTAKEIFNVSINPHVVTIQILKGGTGKTTLTHSIAVRASLYGLKVLCIDIDHQANLTRAFNIKTSHDHPTLLNVIEENISIEDAILPIHDGLDLLPSSIRNSVLDTTLILNNEPLNLVYKDKIEPLKKKYDLIFIDCPPSIGRSVAAAMLSSDLIIIPINPDEFSLEALNFNFNEMSSLGRKHHMDLKIKILFNKFHGRTNLSYEYLKDLIKHEVYGPCMFNAFIRSSQEFPNAVSRGVSIFDTVRANSAREDIDLVTRELISYMGYTPPSRSRQHESGIYESPQELVTTI